MKRIKERRLWTPKDPEELTCQSMNSYKRAVKDKVKAYTKAADKLAFVVTYLNLHY